MRMIYATGGKLDIRKYRRYYKKDSEHDIGTCHVRYYWKGEVAGRCGRKTQIYLRWKPGGKWPGPPLNVVRGMCRFHGAAPFEWLREDTWSIVDEEEAWLVAIMEM